MGLSGKMQRLEAMATSILLLLHWLGSSLAAWISSGLAVTATSTLPGTHSIRFPFIREGSFAFRWNGSQWQDSRIGGGNARGKNDLSPVTGFQPGRMDVFWKGEDGHVYSTWYSFRLSNFYIHTI